VSLFIYSKVYGSLWLSVASLRCCGLSNNNVNDLFVLVYVTSSMLDGTEANNLKCCCSSVIVFVV